MQRTILAIILFAAAAAAQTFTNVSLTKGYGHAQIFYTSTIGGGSVWVGYGPYSGGTCTIGASFDRPAAGANTPSQTKPIAALTPSTRYCVDLWIGSTHWDCNASPAVSGFDGCDASTGYGLFTTDALPAKFSTPQELAQVDVSALPTAPLAVTPGKTWNVTAGSFSSLTTQLAACAAGVGAGEVGEVVVPLGTYTGTYGVPSVSGSGGLCILRAPDVSKLPPNGVRTSPQWAPQMPIIQAPLSNNGHWADVTTSSLYWQNSQGWYVLGIQFQAPDTTVETLPELDIVAANTAGNSFTVSGTPGPEFANHRVVQIKGLTGWADPPNGPAIINGVSGSQISINSPSLPSGTYPGVGGKIRAAGAEQVCGASNTTPIVITTCRDHWFPNRGAVAVNSASGSVLSVSSGNPIGNYSAYSVIIEGSSVPEYNAVWRVASTTDTSITIVNGPESPCSSSCGTVRRLDPIMLSGVQGNTAANGTWYYSTTGARTLTLHNTAGNGAYVSGTGYIAQENMHFPALVAVDKTSSRVHFDRCYFKGKFPNRISWALAHWGSDSSVINNYFDDIQFASLSWPGANAFAALYTMNGQVTIYVRTATAIEMTHGPNKLFQNNYIEAHGISMFAQDPGTPVGNPVPQNVKIARNYFYASLTKIYGMPQSDGIYYAHRHHLEWKRGNKYLIEGNRFRGGWADFQACGPLVMTTPVTGVNFTSDLWFRYNIFEEGTEGFYGVGVAASSPSTLNAMSQRFYFNDNLFRDLDGSRISSIFNAGGAQYCGRPFRFEWPMASLVIEHNTMELPYGGLDMKTFAFKQGFFSGVRIQNNIAFHSGYQSRYSYAPILQAGWDGTSATPEPSYVGGATERSLFGVVFGPNSEYSHNILVPGTRSGSYTGTSTGSNGDTRTYYDSCVSEPTVNRGTWANFKGFRCLGNPAGGDNANQRRPSPRWINPVLNGDWRLLSTSPALASTNRSISVTSASNGVLTVASGHGFQVGYTGTISGASNNALNGSWTVSAIGDTTITLTGATGISCTNPCGATFYSPDARVTTDGRDPGADMDALESAQGRVKNARVPAVGSTTATVAYTAPDTAECTLEYGTSAAWGTGTRAPDGGGIPYRRVDLTGLSSGTTYYYRVLCAAEQPSGAFTTR